MKNKNYEENRMMVRNIKNIEWRVELWRMKNEG